MEKKEIQSALMALAKHLPARSKIELSIVGGAAGLLSGELGGRYSTSDVDVLNVVPSKEWDNLQDAAARVGQEMHLPANWLNGDVGLFGDTLPADWETRRIELGQFGAVKVWVVGRLDLIAMKMFSHRERDIDHLHQMNPTTNELKFVLNYLDSFDDPSKVNRIEMTRNIVEHWK